jgi:hypothetical protein
MAGTGLGARRICTLRTYCCRSGLPASWPAFTPRVRQLHVAIFIALPNMTTLPVMFQGIQESSSPLPVAGTALLLVVRWCCQ